MDSSELKNLENEINLNLTTFLGARVIKGGSIKPLIATINFDDFIFPVGDKNILPFNSKNFENTAISFINKFHLDGYKNGFIFDNSSSNDNSSIKTLLILSQLFKIDLPPNFEISIFSGGEKVRLDYRAEAKENIENVATRHGLEDFIPPRIPKVEL